MHPQTRNDSDWVARPLLQPKTNTNRLLFVSNFRNLNKQLNYRPYYMPRKRKTTMKS